MDYFKAEKLSERLYRIVEISGVCCYLVIGDERACLLDTGCGYGNLAEFVKKITEKPVFVILTHGHHDHMGAAALFDEVYLNHEDLPVFKSFGHMNRRLEEARLYKETAHFTEDDLVPVRTAPMLKLKDQDTFSLGGITIKMLLVKGHTPGMMCPLLIEERIIIFGDACGVGVLLFDEFSSTVSEYRESLIKLKKYESEYDTIYRNHGTFFSKKALLDNVIECCDLILEGKDDHIPVTAHGYKLFEAKKTDGHGRVDKKEGNIMYASEKAQ